MEGFVVINFPIYVLCVILIMTIISILLWRLYKAKKQCEFWQDRYENIKCELSKLQDDYYKIKFAVPDTEKENKNAKNWN
jgi:3-deoxy-D-manno-octulosonic-acid transferase